MDRHVLDAPGTGAQGRVGANQIQLRFADKKVMRFFPFVNAPILAVLACAVALNSAFVSADERFRPLTPGELPVKPPSTEHPLTTKMDEFVRVKNAKLAWMDAAALRRDFPELRGRTDAEIAEWILREFAFVRKSQLQLNEMRNTPIPVEEGALRRGFRPPGYRRAAVLETGLASGGLVDVKGIGHADDPQLAEQVELFRKNAGNANFVEKLRVKGHSDGLMSFGEAIAEVTRQRAAQKSFDLYNLAHGTNFQTVESYFIISLPSEILREGNTRIPAALYGRQANLGRGSGLRLPPGIYRDRYGFMQQTLFGTAVDFGGVIIEDERLKHMFGPTDFSDMHNPQKSKAWAWGHDTARAFFYSGDDDAVRRHVAEMLAPIEQDWSKTSAAKMLEKFRVPDPALAGELPPRLFSRISELVDSPDRQTKYRAMELLRVLELTPEHAALYARLISDADQETRVRAYNSLATHRESPLYLTEIAKYLDHPDPAVLRYVGATLANQRGPDAVPLLAKALESPNSEIQKSAMNGLQEIAKKHGGPAAALLRTAKMGGCVKSFIQGAINP